MRVDNKNENGKSRMVAADVLRCVACYLVISIHFLMNSGFLFNNCLRKENVFGGAYTMRMYNMCAAFPYFIRLFNE